LAALGGDESNCESKPRVVGTRADSPIGPPYRVVPPRSRPICGESPMMISDMLKNPARTGLGLSLAGWYTLDASQLVRTRDRSFWHWELSLVFAIAKTRPPFAADDVCFTYICTYEGRIPRLTRSWKRQRRVPPRAVKICSVQDRVRPFGDEHGISHFTFSRACEAMPNRGRGRLMGCMGPARRFASFREQ
jgi:hypothetical protein